MFAAYLLAILVGGLLLYTPWARRYEISEAYPSISLVDSFFTATSAVCVTGLSVRSTGNYFSFFGQAVILLLVQIGGVGIMTITTFFTKLLGAGDTLRERQTLSETLGHNATEGVRRIGLQVLGATLIIEAIGTAILFPAFLRHPDFVDRPFLEVLWWTVFHAVSAFCNAGFGLHDLNLIPWKTDPVVNFTIMGLIITGGIGFPVMADIRRTLVRQARATGRPWSRLWGRLLLSTKLILLGTFCLIVGGTMLIALLEWNRALADLAWPDKLMASLFASITSRTAGFNTLDYGTLSASTLFVTMLFMVVGGAPASTAGGIKVSTMMVLLLLAWSRLRGKPHVTAFNRTITQNTIDRANVVVILFGMLTILGTIGILAMAEVQKPDGVRMIEHDFFLKACFEVTSSLSTVGLSTGITSSPILGDLGKLILIALMFAGRLGPLTLYLVLAREERGMKARPVREEVPLG